MDLLAVLLHDRKDLLELRQHGIIEIRELGTPDLELDLPSVCLVEQGTYLIYDGNVRPVQDSIFDIAGIRCSNIEFRHVAGDIDTMKFFLPAKTALSYLHRELRHAFPAGELCLFLLHAGFILVIDGIVTQYFTELVKPPSIQLKIRTFSFLFIIVVAHLTDAVDQVLLLLDDLAQEFMPLSCAGTEIVDILVQLCARTILHGLGIPHLLTELDQILDYKKLPHSDPEREAQPIAVSYEPRRKVQNLLLHGRTRHDLVRVTALEISEQHRAPLVRRITHFLLLHVRLRIREHRCDKRTIAVLSGIPAIAIGPAALRTATVRPEHRLSVEDHTDAELMLAVIRHRTDMGGHIVHLIIVSDIDAFHADCAGIHVLLSLLQCISRKFELFPDRIDIKILVLHCRCRSRCGLRLLLVLSRDRRFYLLLLLPHCFLFLLPFSFFGFFADLLLLLSLACRFLLLPLFRFRPPRSLLLARSLLRFLCLRTPAPAVCLRCRLLGFPLRDPPLCLLFLCLPGSLLRGNALCLELRLRLPAALLGCRCFLWILSYCRVPQLLQIIDTGLRLLCPARCFCHCILAGCYCLLLRSGVLFRPCTTGLFDLIQRCSHMLTFPAAPRLGTLAFHDIRHPVSQRDRDFRPTHRHYRRVYVCVVPFLDRNSAAVDRPRPCQRHTVK